MNIEKVREEAAEHAKRVVALGWARPDHEVRIADAWEAGYVFASIDNGENKDGLSGEYLTMEAQINELNNQLQQAQISLNKKDELIDSMWRVMGKFCKSLNELK